MGRRSHAKHLDFFKESGTLNNATYNYYLNRLLELSVSCFRWENLPPTVDSRYMETQLFYNACVVYFRDDVVGDLCLNVTPQGPYDVYGEPTRRRAYSRYNNYQMNLTSDDSVIIWNNYGRTSDFGSMQLFAYRMYDIDRTLDTNVRAQKTPILIQCSTQQRLSLLNLYKEWDGNAPVIFGDKSLDINGIKAIKTDAPFVAESINAIRLRIWSEALSMLGIENSGVQKKARLVTAEANALQGETYASRQSRLKAREQAAEKINRMFGTDIKVYFDDGIQTAFETMAETLDGIDPQELTETEEEGESHE